LPFLTFSFIYDDDKKRTEKVRFFAIRTKI
jgi:hypothetical protein